MPNNSYQLDGEVSILAPEPKPIAGNFSKYYANRLEPEKIFGIANDPYSGGVWLDNDTLLPRKDEVLNQLGGGSSRAIEIYQRLFNDAQVASSFDKFITEILQRPIIVQAASTSQQDEYIAEFVRQTLSMIGSNTRQSVGKAAITDPHTGFNALVRGLGESYILGLAGAGINWIKLGKHYVPGKIEIVDTRRIEMSLAPSGDISPRLIVWHNEGYIGKEIPARTFIAHRYWSSHGIQDPWGYGLGRQLYPLVEFRRNVMSLWLQYCDKNTTPNVVVNYEPGISKEDHDRIFEIARTFGQGTVAMFPTGVSANYLTPSSSAPNTYQNLISYLDQQISWLITGERDPAQSGQATGSLPQTDRLADSIRVKKAKAFNDTLEATINNTLIRWIVELNFGMGVTPPKVVRNFSDLNDRSNKQSVVALMSTLKGLGYVVNDLDWIKEQLNIPSLAYDPMMVQQSQGAAIQGGLPTEGDISEPEPIAGEEEGGFAEPENQSDGKVRVSTVADVLGLDLDVLMRALALDDKNALVDVDELVEDFLSDDDETDLKAQPFEVYRDKAKGGTPYYHSLSKEESSIDEAPDNMMDKATSKDKVNKQIALALKGIPRQIGYDALTEGMTQYEQTPINVPMQEKVPVYEIINAIEHTLTVIRRSNHIMISTEMTTQEKLRLAELERLHRAIEHNYTKKDLSYQAKILKEEVREFEHLLYEGHKDSVFNYDKKLALLQPIEIDPAELRYNYGV